MATKSDLARLPKSSQKVARSAISKATGEVRKKLAEERVINTGLGYLAAGGAALIDDKFRTGIESEARFGQPGQRIRPPVNAVIAVGLTAVGLAGPKKMQGAALATGLGFGAPALYAFTRNMLARQ